MLFEEDKKEKTWQERFFYGDMTLDENKLQFVCAFGSVLFSVISMILHAVICWKITIFHFIVPLLSFFVGYWARSQWMARIYFSIIKYSVIFGFIIFILLAIFW